MKRLGLSVPSAVGFALIAGLAYSAPVALSWDPNPATEGVTEYAVQMSTDQGKTWGAEISAGTATTLTIATVPDTGLVLLRVLARSPRGMTIRTDAGAWYCGDWRPPSPAKGAGIQ